MSDGETNLINTDASIDGKGIPTLTLFNGNKVKVLTNGKSTDQRLTVIEYLDSTRGNPPPFTRHDFIEVFAVVEGRLAFQYYGEPAFYVSSGNAVTVPSGLAHTFWNPDDKPSRILLACTPAGLDGFFEAIHRESERLKAGEIDQAEATASMARLRLEYGIEETAAAPLI